MKFVTHFWDEERDEMKGLVSQIVSWVDPPNAPRGPRPSTTSHQSVSLKAFGLGRPILQAGLAGKKTARQFYLLSTACDARSACQSVSERAFLSSVTPSQSITQQKAHPVSEWVSGWGRASHFVALFPNRNPRCEKMQFNAWIHNAMWFK